MCLGRYLVAGRYIVCNIQEHHVKSMVLGIIGRRSKHAEVGPLKINRIIFVMQQHVWSSLGVQYTHSLEK